MELHTFVSPLFFDFYKRSLTVLILCAVVTAALTGCAARKEKETWNSYYYGTPSTKTVNSNKVDYDHFPVDNDATYALPSNYWEWEPDYVEESPRKTKKVPRQ